MAECFRDLTPSESKKLFSVACETMNALLNCDNGLSEDVKNAQQELIKVLCTINSAIMEDFNE